MAFEVRRNNAVEKEWKRLDNEIKDKWIRAFKTLEETPVPREKYDVIKLGGRKQTYRIRIGQWRAVYYVGWEEKIVLVLIIDKRSDNTYNKF